MKISIILTALFTLSHPALAGENDNCVDGRAYAMFNAENSEKVEALAKKHRGTNLVRKKISLSGDFSGKDADAFLAELQAKELGAGECTRRNPLHR